MRRTLAGSALALGLLVSVAAADDPAESPGGAPHRVHALVGASVVPRPGTRLEHATVVIRDGLIEAVGEGVIPPADARVWDATGLTVYPGLIEPYLPLSEPADGAGEVASAPGGARHENPAVRADVRVAERLALDADRLRALRRAGFTAALVAPTEGLLRGTSALVALGDGPPRAQVLQADVAQHLTFQPARRERYAYPASLMGGVALVRQTLLDAEHYLATWSAYGRAPLGRERPATDVALGALLPTLEGTRPVCVEAPSGQDALRAVAVLAEFELLPWLVLDPDARWLDEVAHTTAPLIVSLNFPPAPRWEGEEEAVEVETEALRRWQLAPEVPGRLERAQARFSLSSHGLADRGVFRARVRAALARGLSEEAALAAFTTAPAALLKAPQLGVIAPGAAANLTVSDGELFGEATRIVETWIDGVRYPAELGPPAPAALVGTWRLEVAGRALALKLEHERGELRAELAPAAAEGAPAGEPAWVEAQPPALWRDRLTLHVPGALLGGEVPVTFTCRVKGRLLSGRSPGDLQVEPIAIRGRLEAPAPQEAAAPEGEAAPSTAPAAGDPWGSWPPVAPAAPPAVLLRDATVWTQGPQGTLEGADLLVQGGRVAGVGYDLEAPPGALVIDATGHHVTPGIIDCHSHAFVQGGVNEGTRSCTAQVRIADVIDAQSVNIYRQLAGGVTTANLLHGSANAIGGQSAVVQLRWREPPQRMLMEGAPPGIKFALGENPKRSNWGQQLAPRFPSSRLGVSEVIRERFLAARNYQRQLLDWRLAAVRDPGASPPRIDLELEALSEVLAGRRKVHCHSYRQDEILAMVRLAEELGFTVGTFQHVLEGYKVADELAAHGAGASTFSDWWAYKFEVYDAIAYNGALMHQRGVLVSFNSDSAEMARRLNLEAAKAVRYGGLSPEEALALVTINPARQLGIDAEVGSLEVGKQADFAVWSGHPLEATSRCEQTWIEGQPRFDRRLDEVAFARGAAEREALLAAARAARFEQDAVSPEGWRPTFGARATSAEHACCGRDER